MTKERRESSLCRRNGWMSLMMPAVLSMLMLCMSTPVMRGAGMPQTADSLTAIRVFADIPLDVLDMLRPSTRLDMIDYYEHADSLWSAPNALGGNSRFLEVTDDYIRMEVTPVSTFEIKLLPYKKGKVVMTLYTVGSDDTAKDTEVRFFDASLSPLPAEKFLNAPDLRNFINLKGRKASESRIREAIPFMAICYTTGPGDTPLTARLTTIDFLPTESQDLLRPLLLPPPSSIWKSGFHF